MSRSGEKPRGPDWIAWALGAAALVFGFTLCRRGIILSDEGYLLLQSLDLANGKVLYRDMDSFVAPGVWFLLAGLFKLFEPSVFTSRMAALACWGGTLFVAARCVDRVAGRRWAWATAAALMLATVWAFPAWTWSFYSPYAVLFALAALERVLAWREAERGRDLVGAGVFVGLAIVFKQNYGVFTAAGAGLAIAAVRLERGARPRELPRDLLASGLRLAAGAAAVVLPFLAYFAFHGALCDAFRALVVHPFGAFLGQHDIAYLPPSEIYDPERMLGRGRYTYGAFAFNHTTLSLSRSLYLIRGVEILHVLLYWIPPLFFAAAGLLVWRSRGSRLDGGLASVLAMAGCVFVGVFPRADFNHLMNVYQPFVVLVVVVVHRLAGLRSAHPAALRWGVRLGAALLVPYLALGVYWYATLLTDFSDEVAGPRGGVLLTPDFKLMLDFEVDTIRHYSRPGDAVLTLPGFAMMNFLADRPMPGRYYNFYAVHIAHDRGAEVVHAIEQERVGLVVADYQDFFSETVGMREYAPLLTDHLRRFFQPFFSVAIDQHLFLKRRDRPRPLRASRSAVADCDVGSVEWWKRGVWDQLLFETLYHPLQRGKTPRSQVSTLCRVQVPERAILTFALGYRQPSTIEPGTSLVAEVWVHEPERRETGFDRLFRQELELKAVEAWVSPPPVEGSVDLSGFAGEEVILLFRTLYAGEARMHPLDFKGFAMVWRDPRIEFPESGRQAARGPLE